MTAMAYDAETWTGNFHRDEASDFLRGFASVLRPGDTMLVGLDSCLDPAKVLYDQKSPSVRHFARMLT